MVATVSGAASAASAHHASSGVADHAATNSINPYGPDGMNVDAAQATVAAGTRAAGFTPHVVVAYIEGGINWFDSGAEDLADSVYVNWHDTPVPCDGATVATATMTLNGKTVPCATAYSSHESDYDTNGDGEITVQDWAQDPRVNQDADGAGYLNPEDLIAAFSGPGYAPTSPSPAGYSDAISGWDFYDNQNDPATTDASYDHSDGQMNVIHTICPTCLIMPVKAGDEAIDSTEDLAKAWLFAAQAGAQVIVSVTADLGYSTFARQVLAYLDQKGVIVVEASNDFDSTDHQGGMYWGNVIPGNGLIANTAGVPSGSTLSSMAGPFWTRSDYTSWGVHAMFSVATNGGTTSESTPTTGAVLALVLSEGEEAAATHTIAGPLSGPQAVQILQQASTEPTAPAGSSLTWPSGPGTWNEQYGYGMPDVETAVTAVADDEVPAAPEIDSPDWYTIADPTTQKSVTVTGTVSAYPDQSYTWDLQYNTGADPQTWHNISSGIASGDFSGTFGTLDLSAIPASFYKAPFSLSTTKELETSDEYDVTFRVVTAVRGHWNLVGIARRVIDVFHDPTALSGFPLDIGSSGESQPALVDLQGTGNLDIVFGTSDGTIDAIDPKTGQELPGWPAHTDAVTDADLPAGVSAGYQPIVSDLAVGDLFHTGQLSVVATSQDGYVYVFNSHGQLMKGWPILMDAGVAPPPIPRPSLPHQRNPQEGDTAPPVLVALKAGSQALDIVQAGWDGEIHAWNGYGKTLAGWPVRVTLTAAEEDLPSGYTLEDDQKLDTPPVVADFSHTGPPDLVIRSQYTEIGSSVGGLQVLPYFFVFAYTAAGKLVKGWPVRMQGTIEDYGSAQEFLTEGTDSPSAADVLGAAGDNLDQVAVGGVWSPDSLLSASGRVLGSYGSKGAVLKALLNIVSNPQLAISGSLPGPTPTPFSGSGAFGVLGSQLVYAEPTMGAESLAASLLYPGSGNAIQQLDSVWPALAGNGTTATSELPGFPTDEQGDDFLGQPLIAPVGNSSGNDLVTGGDSSAVNGQLADGAEAPGFPKFTGGWSMYAPSAGDLFGNGKDDLVTVTREGYLFAWSTKAPAPTTGSWWRAFHDEYNSGNEATDSRPPGVVRKASLSGAGLRFEAPGANWYDGQSTSYQLIYVSSTGQDSAVKQVADSTGAGHMVTLAVPAGTRAVYIRSVNSSGLLSAAEKVTSAGQATVAWP